MYINNHLSFHHPDHLHSSPPLSPPVGKVVKARRPRISTRLDFTPPRLPLMPSHRSPLLLFPTPRSPSQTLSIAQTARARTNSTHAEDPKKVIFRETEDKDPFSVSCRQTSKKRKQKGRNNCPKGRTPPNRRICLLAIDAGTKKIPRACFFSLPAMPRTIL
jgi:hypothetical protein